MAILDKVPTCCAFFAACLCISTQAACPVTSRQCGTCPSMISDKFNANAAVQMMGSSNYRCTIAGKNALTAAGCVEKKCLTSTELNFPFKFSDCAKSNTDACLAWKWLSCAFPNDKTADGTVMHAYFFVKGMYEGMGFDLAAKDVASLVKSRGAALVSNGCAEKFPSAAKVVKATMEAGKSKGLVLFGWDGCPCTGIAHNRFSSIDLCYEELTWSNGQSDVMQYLQCMEGDQTHHSFVYTRDGNDWKFRGTGFEFDAKTMTGSQLDRMAIEAKLKRDCVNEFSVNIYGEALSECRAAQTDSSGSWMWDGKCTEKGGGVHQICMDKLPPDFSVNTGQGPWSQGRANMRHCVCIGAWSLYMTREEDPTFKTSVASPFCDAIPLSSLTSAYIGNWKDWNGIPASIVLGASKLFTKCLKHRSGPGSQGPALSGACHLAKAFRDLQQREPSLRSISVDNHLKEAGLNCSHVKLPELGRPSPSTGGGGSGGTMLKTKSTNRVSSSNSATSSAFSSSLDASQSIFLFLAVSMRNVIA